MQTLYALIAGFILCHEAVVSAQQTNIMTFESLAHADANTNFYNRIRENHMLISASPFAKFGVLGSDAGLFAGSTGIFNPAQSGFTVLSRTNGAVFDFTGIDLAGLTAEATTVTFLGYRDFVLVATQAWALPANLGGTFLSFTTSNFCNVTDVRWNHTYPAVHQFDNLAVVLHTNAPAADPLIRLKSVSSTNQQGVVSRFGVLDACRLIPGTEYALDYSTDLSNWQLALPSFHAHSTFQSELYLTMFVATNRFYRLRQP